VELAAKIGYHNGQLRSEEASLKKAVRNFLTNKEQALHTNADGEIKTTDTTGHM